MPLSLTPYINNLSIRTTKLEVRKFNLNYVDPDPTIGDWGWAQRRFVAEVERQYNAGLPVRIITLKARQLGISTVTEAILFLWNFIHVGSSNLVLTHQDPVSQRLFNMTKLYWETWPHKVLYSLKYGTRRQLTWVETGSDMSVATASNKEGLRGATLHGLHGSEVAQWPDAETLWTGLNNTIPRRHKTLVVLESTAKGVGNWFHEKWLEAEAGDSEFVPLFFPWFEHPAYRVRHSLTRADLDSEERQILRLCEQAYMDVDSSLAAIAWRRLEIPRQGGIDNFCQEFPATPDEAFIVSGRPLFSVRDVQQCLEQKTGVTGDLYRSGDGTVQFRDNPSGCLTLFKLPDNRDPRPDRYMIAGDPSRTVYGDPGCIQVLNRQNLEQVAVWHGHKRPGDFAHEMMLIGDFFQHGILCPEVEGGGQGTISVLMSSNYGNMWLHRWADRHKTSTSVYGWSTNYQRKWWAIGTLQKLLGDASLLLHDKRTAHELVYYVENEDGTLGNGEGARHDDRVSALYIAVTASTTDGPFIPSNLNHQSPTDIYTTEFETPTYAGLGN